MTISEKTGVFDLSDADGVNESARLLMSLCRKSFLSLWAHANLHTDQDMREGKGSAKEFADVMVVFGNDIVIFSDKHITFQAEADTGVAWKRWYKRAISNSAKQLYGAKNWLQRFPDRVFLDSKCTRTLPVRIPDIESVRFHLVAVTRGSAEACAKHFSGSFGTHMINTGLSHNDYPDYPFTTGPLDSGKEFVHVFDELSLEILMREMTTVRDFVEYLAARKAFLLTPDTVITSAGEEQLIANYLMHNDDNACPFLPISGATPKLISFDETHYSALTARTDYKAMHEENKKSAFWDTLIEKFIALGDPTITELGANQLNHETELALRLMASETRLMRRELTFQFFDMMQRAKNGHYGRRSRTLTTLQSPDILYIFLACPKLEGQTNEIYRRYRSAMLLAYAQCAKLRFPLATTVIALGFDHPLKDYRGGSEDLCVYIHGDYSADERAEVERLREQLGIYAGANLTQDGTSFQFPGTLTRALESAAPSHHTDTKKKLLRAKKAKNKKQKQARKAGRRK